MRREALGLRTAYPFLMRRAIVLVLLSALSSCGHHGASSADDTKVAPGFAGATAWLNVDHALTLDELRGKVVVVDFWTSCCINCIHTLPVLAEVEKEVRGEAGRRDRRALGQVRRGERSRPSARDRGRVLHRASHRRRRIDEAVERVGHPGLADGPRARREGAHRLEPHRRDRPRRARRRDPQALDEGTKAGSSTENRSRVFGERSTTRARSHSRARSSRSPTGRSRSATRDTTASFSLPPMARSRASSGAGSRASPMAASPKQASGSRRGSPNRVISSTSLTPRTMPIRVVDRHARTVVTVAGTGELGSAPLEAAPAPARSTRLRSPWEPRDVEGALYVALAGSHQIGLLSTRDGTIARSRATQGATARRRRDGLELRPAERAHDRREIALRRGRGELEHPRGVARDARRAHARRARSLRLR